eukprot:355524-Chlamydomonas_euryale.AAC.23
MPCIMRVDRFTAYAHPSGTPVAFCNDNFRKQRSKYPQPWSADANLDVSSHERLRCARPPSLREASRGRGTRAAAPKCLAVAVEPIFIHSDGRFPLASVHASRRALLGSCSSRWPDSPRPAVGSSHGRRTLTLAAQAPSYGLVVEHTLTASSIHLRVIADALRRGKRRPLCTPWCTRHFQWPSVWASESTC